MKKIQSVLFVAILLAVIASFQMQAKDFEGLRETFYHLNVASLDKTTAQSMKTDQNYYCHMAGSMVLSKDELSDSEAEALCKGGGSKSGVKVFSSDCKKNIASGEYRYAYMLERHDDSTWNGERIVAKWFLKLNKIELGGEAWRLIMDSRYDGQEEGEGLD